MYNPALLFAILTGVCLAGYSTFQKLGSASITPAVGGMVISIVAFLVNLVVALTLKATHQDVHFTREGLVFLILVGLSAGGADLFSLAAYSAGLPVSASLIITGVQLSLLLLIGVLLLGEPFTWTRLAAVGLIAAGILLLQQSGS